MKPLFGKNFNTFSKLTAALAFLGAGGVLFLGDQVQKSPYMTEVRLVKDQPVPFSHQHHVAGLGIDCRYCHTSVEKAAFAGIPPTSTCMNCHSQIWADSPMLEPVRESYRTGKPIRWNRIHDLPDFVYFNHSIHVSKGIGCTTCHGKVQDMPLMWKEKTLYMGWCLECHRNPNPYKRETGDIFNHDWQPKSSLIHAKWEKTPPHEMANVNCSACHR